MQIPLPLAAAGLVVSVALASASRMPSAAQPSRAEPAKVIALVGDRALTWNDLGPELAEAAGAQVLEEHALGLLLEQICRERGIAVSADAIKAERRLLAELLSASAEVSADDAERLIATVRANRGLGDRRFSALLERNAALRAIVRKDSPVTITDDDIDTAYALKFGPRYRARLILVATPAQAEQAAARLAAGESFADVAAQVSLDPSAARGGILEPFSASDSRYPVAVRRALAELKDGATSAPIAVNWGESIGSSSGFVIVRNDGVAASSGQVPEKTHVHDALEREIRAVRERAEMDKLARTLVKSGHISPMDTSLNWAWTQREGR